MSVASRNVPIRSSQECALLVIDMQEYCSLPERGYHKDVKRNDNVYFFDRVDHAVSNIQKLLPLARLRKVEVLYTFIEAQTKDGRDSSLDYKLSGPILVPKNHRDARVLEKIRPLEDDILLPKTSCSVFQSTNIDYILRNLGTRNLVICGQLTNQCVESAVRDAADLGYLVTVVEDACAAETESAHMNSLGNMKGFSRIVSSADLTAELNRLNPEGNKDFGACVDVPVKVIEVEDQSSETTESKAREYFETSPNAVLQALMLSLKASGVKYLRVMNCDAAANVRTKAMKLTAHSPAELANGVGMVECLMGLHSEYDVVVEGCGLGVSGMFNLVPDFTSFRILPYAKGHASTYGFLCEQGSGRAISPLCPRGFLRRHARAAEELQLRLQVGVELEFVMRNADGSFADNTTWASCGALDESCEVFDAIDECLSQQGVAVRLIHSESCAGQFEVVLQHSSDVLAMADAILTAKQSIKAVANRHGKVVSFVPKVDAMQAGSGMHVHMSCASDQEAFMAGILHHILGLTAILAPTTNSFRRLQPGCWAGNKACWGIENKEAPLRLCDNGSHFECKSTDATCNPYLAIGALIAAGVDGINKRMVLPAPINKDPATLNTSADIRSLPSSLDDALDALEGNTILMDALGAPLAKAYLAVKRAEAKHYNSMKPEDEVKSLEKRF